MLPKAKSLPQQIAANSRWSKEDPTRQGEIMRGGMERRFLDEVDPDRKLTEGHGWPGCCDFPWLGGDMSWLYRPRG
jgi:hypothetical protein